MENMNVQPPCFKQESGMRKRARRVFDKQRRHLEEWPQGNDWRRYLAQWQCSWKRVEMRQSELWTLPVRVRLHRRRRPYQRADATSRGGGLPEERDESARGVFSKEGNSRGHVKGHRAVWINQSRARERRRIRW